MKLFIIPVAVVAFAAGYILHPAIESMLVKSMGILRQYPTSIKEHWHAVEYYREHQREIHEREQQIGIHQQYDVVPSLVALASAHEIEHLDLVFPEVPYDGPAIRYLLKWSDSNNDILYWIGGGGNGEYQTTGKQPLHFQIWFKKSAKADVQQMIKDIESLPKE